MIGKALLNSNRTVAVHFLLFLFIPRARQWQQDERVRILFLFSTSSSHSFLEHYSFLLLHLHYTTHSFYFVLSITRYHKRQKTRAKGSVPLVLWWKDICLKETSGESICTKQLAAETDVDGVGAFTISPSITIE